MTQFDQIYVSSSENKITLMDVIDFSVKKEHQVESNVHMIIITPKYIIVYDEMK